MNNHTHARYLSIILLLFSLIIAVLFTPQSASYDIPNGLGEGKTQTLILENGSEISIELEEQNYKWLDIARNSAILFIISLTLLFFLMRQKK